MVSVVLVTRRKGSKKRSGGGGQIKFQSNLNLFSLCMWQNEMCVQFGQKTEILFSNAVSGNQDAAKKASVKLLLSCQGNEEDEWMTDFKKEKNRSSLTSVRERRVRQPPRYGFPPFASSAKKSVLKKGFSKAENRLISNLKFAKSLPRIIPEYKLFVCHRGESEGCFFPFSFLLTRTN